MNICRKKKTHAARERVEQMGDVTDASVEHYMRNTKRKEIQRKRNEDGAEGERKDD